MVRAGRSRATTRLAPTMQPAESADGRCVLRYHRRRVEHLTAALLIVGGLALFAGLDERIASVRAFAATALLVLGLSWIIRGPTRVFAGPPLVMLARIGVSYGAVAAAAGLAFPKQVPKPIAIMIGALCVIAGVLLLLFKLRVIKPT